MNLTENVINKRIELYCKEKGIALTKKLFNKTKHEKLLMLDSYEALRNAVWDYLKIDGEIDALNLANLVYDIIKMEKGEVLRHNEDTLFENKQRGYVADFPKHLSEHPNVQTAKQVLRKVKVIKKLLVLILMVIKNMNLKVLKLPVVFLIFIKVIYLVVVV